MANTRVTDLIVQIAATVIATGVIALLAQGFSVFRRLSSLEVAVKEIRREMKATHSEFHASHQLFEDGEFHHRRGKGV